MPPVRVSSGGESGWGEAGMYGPPEPVAAAIKVEDVIIDDDDDDDDDNNDPMILNNRAKNHTSECTIAGP